MTIPQDGQFTGKSCQQVDSSNETTNAMAYTRPSFDGFGYQNETGSATGSQMGFPGGGDQVIQGHFGHQSPNSHTSFDPTTSRHQVQGDTHRPAVYTAIEGVYPDMDDNNGS